MGEPGRGRRTANLAALDELTTREPPPSPIGPVARGRSLPDLSSLYNDTPSETAGPQIPAELQTYISPDLWRKLNAAEPPRGVLINALERVRSVLYQLNMFLPPHLAQEKMRRAVPGLVGGQMVRGSLLFSDVSGFTALSERLAALGRQGAEDLTEVINRYFTAMLDIVAKSGGILLKFAGDATLVYFPEVNDGEQAGWAVRAGMRMLAAMPDFARIETPSQPVSLQMKIGVATGEFLAASVGSAKRMEYVVLGEAVARTLAAEGTTTGAGQLIVDEATARLLSPAIAVIEHTPGFRRVTQGAAPDDDFEIKAETRRARGAIPWSASPQAIIAQIEIALRQIQAVTPYLASELAAQIVAQAATRQARARSQFRLSTILFCNFVMPEKLLPAWGEAGASRLTGLLSAYFTAMHEVIARYGGVVTRIDPYSQGQKLLVLFGAPVAHEDDPQRAVSTALAMNIELELLNEQWQRRFARHLPPDFRGPLVQHRIGITCGDTYAGQVGSPTRREYTVMGDDVNLSARLMSAAEMGQILLSQHIYEKVADYFHLVTLPPIRAKGKSKPVAIYRVEGPRDDTLANRAHSRGALIGREAELAQGQAVLQHAANGQGSLLTIQGAAGIGKSHLADALLQYAQAASMKTLYNQCRSYTAETPYGCWSALLRELAAITKNDFDPRLHHDKLRRLMADLSLSGELEQPLATLIGLRRPAQLEAQPVIESTTAFFDMVKGGRGRRKGSNLDFLDQLGDQQTSETGQVWQPVSANLGDHEREALHAAVWAVLSGLAKLAPTLIFFEDAHWMDEASQGLVADLGRKINGIPMVILLARRGEDKTIEGEAISLGALAPAGAAALVAHLLISDLAQIIYEQSGGNPLYVDEITRWFKRTHNINAAELRTVLQSSDFLQQLVMSSLESLPETQREVARAASVIGAEFSTGEVQALLPAAIDPVTLSNHLRELVRARVIALSEAGADARYTFQQTILREVLYNSLPFEQRRELHGKLADHLSLPQTRRRQVASRVAAALDADPSTTPAQDAEAIAGHYEQAERWLPAAQNLLRAADLARKQSDCLKAGGFYGRALADLGQLPPDEGQIPEASAARLQAAAGQGDMALATGETLGALTAFELAWSTLSDDVTPNQRLSLACKLALLLPTQRRAADAEKLLRGALSACNPPGDAILAATAYATLAWLLWRAAQPESAEWAERARTQLSDNSSPWATAITVMVTGFEGNWGAARTGYNALGVPPGAALASLRLGDQKLQQNDIPAAHKCYRQAAVVWKDSPAPENGLALALYRQAEVHWRVQESAEARARLDEAQAALPACAPLLHGDGYAAIQAAIKMIETEKPHTWPEWRWQAFDDAFHIALIFHP